MCDGLLQRFDDADEARGVGKGLLDQTVRLQPNDPVANSVGLVATDSADITPASVGTFLDDDRGMQFVGVICRRVREVEMVPVAVVLDDVTDLRGVTDDGPSRKTPVSALPFLIAWKTNSECLGAKRNSDDVAPADFTKKDTKTADQGVLTPGNPRPRSPQYFLIRVAILDVVS